MVDALTLHDVCKTYSTSDFFLDHISFSLPKGMIMGFVGENGAGKTTTIGCILNTLQRDAGTIHILGKKMDDSSTELRNEIGVVYDGDPFPPDLTAEQLAAIMRRVYKRWDDGLFRKYLGEFRLEERRKIGRYSRGMTMKLAMAVALSHHPKLLILDEPTGGLDPISRDEMLDIFLDFVTKEDHAILFSSHITEDLEKIADFITLIHHGRILLSESKDTIRYQYAVLRCKENQFPLLDRQDIVAYRKRAYQTDVLVRDGRIAKHKYAGIIMDRVTIDELMLILTKGNLP